MSDVFTVEAEVGDEITLFRSDTFWVEGFGFSVLEDSAEPIRLVITSAPLSPSETPSPLGSAT